MVECKQNEMENDKKLKKNKWHAFYTNSQWVNLPT